MSVFAKTLSNNFLLKPGTLEQEIIGNLYSAFYSIGEDLVSKIIKKPDQKTNGGEIEIPPLFGEYIWLNNKFSVSNQGSIILDVKGQSDFFVCFANKDISVQNNENKL